MSKTSGVKCPHCDAPLEYDGSSRYITCGFCGSTVEVTGENEFVIRKVDEAEIQKTKTERAVRLKELDVQNATDERDAEHQNRWRIIWGAIVVVCLIAGLLGNEDMFYLAVIAAIIGFGGKYFKALFKKADEIEAREKKERQDKIDSGYIVFPESLSYKIFQTVKVQAAVEMLTNAGFTKVFTVNLKDLKDKSDKDKKDIIEKVLIDGNMAYKNEIYPPDATVQVQYHDFTDEYYNNPVRVAMSAVSSKIRSNMK